MRLHMDERLVLVAGREVNVKDTRRGWAVTLASVVSLVCYLLVNEEMHVSFSVVIRKENSSGHNKVCGAWVAGSFLSESNSCKFN